MTSKDWTRSVVGALTVILVSALYALIRYSFISWQHWSVAWSNAAFQMGLVLFILGVLYTSRFFGFRKSYNLPKLTGLRPFDVRQQTSTNDDDILLHSEDETQPDSSRSPILIVVALWVIAFSIVVTL